MLTDSTKTSDSASVMNRRPYPVAMAKINMASIAPGVKVQNS
jgi:hypothetical protein